MPFQKGNTLNPGGRPKLAKDIIELARKACPQAIKALVDLLDHPDPKIRKSAADSVLDRGIGKPAQAVEHSGPGGGVFTVQILPMTVEPPKE